MHQKQQGSRLEAPENKNKDRDRDARDVKSEAPLPLKQQMHQKRPGQSCWKKRGSSSPDLWGSYLANVSKATGTNGGTKNKSIESTKDIKCKALMMKIAMYRRQ